MRDILSRHASDEPESHIGRIASLKISHHIATAMGKAMGSKSGTYGQFAWYEPLLMTCGDGIVFVWMQLMDCGWLRSGVVDGGREERREVGIDRYLYLGGGLA